MKENEPDGLKSRYFILFKNLIKDDFITGNLGGIMEVPISKLIKLLDKIKFGETILLEYSSPIWPPLAFYFIAKASLVMGNKLMIDDILDTLYSYKVQLELAGFDTGFLNGGEVFIIKVGGQKAVGNVVATVEFSSDFYLHRQRYKKAFEGVVTKGEHFVDIVLGFNRRIATAHNIYDRLLFAHSRARYLGNRKRVAVYLVNRELLAEYPFILPFLEETSTSVVRLEENGKNPVVKFLKSPIKELNGKTFEIDFNELSEFLRRESG